MTSKPFNVVVCGLDSEGFDDCAFVHSILDRVHRKRRIDMLIHDDVKVAKFASAWAKVNSGVSELQCRPEVKDKDKLRILLTCFQPVSLVIIFGENEQRVVGVARKLNIKVIRRYRRE